MSTSSTTVGLRSSTTTASSTSLLCIPDCRILLNACFLPRVRDVVPSEAGHEYQIAFDPTYSTPHTWWDYGRKWQVLKWRSSPFRGRTYALEDNVNGRNPSRPSKSDAVRMARSGSWIDAGGKLPPPLLMLRAADRYAIVSPSAIAVASKTSLPLYSRLRG